MESLLELFVSVDDSCKAFLPKLKQPTKASHRGEYHRSAQEYLAD